MKRTDIFAGLAVAGLMLPEAVAYAAIAGLPAERGLVAAIVGAALYAWAGRSRFAIISPTSSSAAILAASIGAIGGSAADRATFATFAVLLVALTFLIAGMFRLGGLTSFVSRPVLRGFAFGLAITIIVRQLPVMTGLDIGATDVAGVLWQSLRGVAQWNPIGLALGLAALAALLALRRVHAFPGAVAVLAVGIALSLAFDLAGRGVAVVGPIALHPHWPGLTLPGTEALGRLAVLIPPLFLILLAESWGTMRGLALRHGDELDANRELRALGWANLAAGAAQGMPVGAGFSAGSASEAAGGRSRATGAIAAAALLVLMLVGRDALAHLPKPVLAAVVIAALTHALDPAPLRRLWHLRRDFAVAAAAAAGVLLLGVLEGMLAAILLSLLLLIRRLSSPQIVRLGRLGAHDFVDIERHPDAELPPSLAIWRPAEPLFFGNAEPVFAAVEARSGGGRPMRSIVLSLEESFDIDSSALDALLEFDRRLADRGIVLHLARVRDGIRDLLLRAGAADLVRRCAFSVDDAVTAATADPKGPPA